MNILGLKANKNNQSDISNPPMGGSSIEKNEMVINSGKHSDEYLGIKKLEETVKRKDKELYEIRQKLADVLQQIKELNECNNYGDPTVLRKKISEIYFEVIEKSKNKNKIISKRKRLAIIQIFYA